MEVTDIRIGAGMQEEKVCPVDLEGLLKQGAQKMLQQAIEWEVREYLRAHETERDETGHHLVVQNGWRDSRSIQTGLGDIEICQPRVKDRRVGEKFTSYILPPYLRRSPSIEALIPALYLSGVSSNSFPRALESILGEKAQGLSAASIVRLKTIWEGEYQEWAGRDLSLKKYVYWWADGIYFKVRLTNERPCLLVIMGALADGTKELVAIWDGQRESSLSWKDVLSDLKRRGVTRGPKLAVGDGGLGFWAALEEEYPGTTMQRCWVHKACNIMDKLPASIQPSAHELICQMYMAPKKEEAFQSYNEFLKRYQAKYPKACECLSKDKEVLFAFYSFPAEHWHHIRSTNVIESAFSTVRHRTRQTKGCGSRLATLTMVFKLGHEMEKRWRKLQGRYLIDKVMAGVRFIDGIEEAA